MPRRTSKPGISPAKALAEGDHEALGLERLVFFSDAVFAIAITILVLDIRLPGGEEALSDAQLTAQLLEILPKYMAYIISFLVIGSFWISHHRKFRYVRRYDGRLLWLNLLFLMAIAFIPFPTSVISDYGNRTATIFYALTIIVTGLLSIALWGYATYHNRLVDERLDVNTHRQLFLSPLITLSVFLISIGIAIVSYELARLTWLLLIPIAFILRRKKIII